MLPGGFVITFSESQFVALYDHLPFEQIDLFPRFGGELRSDLRRLSVTNVGREFPASLIIAHFTPGLLELALTLLERFLQLADADLELDQRLPQADSLFSGVWARGKEPVKLTLQVVEIHSVDGKRKAAEWYPPRCAMVKQPPA